MPNVGKLYLGIGILEPEDCGCKVLSVLDESFYLTDPESPTLDIVVPGYETVRFQFEIGKVNIFNSYSLGITNTLTEADLIDLPDGLYELTYSICPNETLYTNVSYLRTCAIEGRIASYWAAKVTLCDTESKIFKELEKIEILLKGGKANAKLCNTDKAIELYRKADDLLKRLENTTNGCNC